MRRCGKTLRVGDIMELKKDAGSPILDNENAVKNQTFISKVIVTKSPKPDFR